MFDNDEMPTPPRSKSVSVISCLLGLATAGFGLFRVLSGTADSTDRMLIAGGLFVAVVGLVLLFRRG